MKTVKNLLRIGGLLAALAFPSLMVGTASAAHVEEKFDVLQTKTGTYTNVTVTTHAKNYIFIMHSTGMRNIKISDLSLETQVELGYAPGGTRKVSTETTVANGKTMTFESTNGVMSKIGLPQIKFDAAWMKPVEATMRKLSGTIILALLGVAFALHLFFSYCASLICKKAGGDPGVMIWLPLLQLLPLLRTAGMSGWWFIGYMIPVVNIVTHILWCINIVEAREKNGLMAVLLILPVTSLFAFLYLAFSDANETITPTKKNDGGEGRPLVLQMV